MSSERILRLKRADGALDSFVLLHVAGYGGSPLHLKLTASEGELTYLTTSKLPGPQLSLSVINWLIPPPVPPQKALTWRSVT
jgi:hypothetical protein